MQKSRPREARWRGLIGGFGVGAGLLAATGAGAAAAAELRHRQAVTEDPLWPLLSAPLQGEPVTVPTDDGVVLHAERFGSDAAATVVLIPGWTEELQVFDLLTRELIRRGLRVVAYDPRGQGSSQAAGVSDQRIERYGQDLGAVLDACCAQRHDVIVAGHSMGAMALVAWAGAAGASARVRAAALISTGVCGLVEATAVMPAVMLPEAARLALIGALIASEQPLMPVSTPLSRALSRHALFGPDASAGQLAFIEPMVARMPAHLRAGAGRTMRELDLRGALAGLDVPTLVVAGALDRLTPPAHARQIADALPNLAELLILDRTGHMTPLERPLELAAALVRLLAQVGLHPERERGDA
jgi:pimeloyl-ACP methyl ester carboxylesterase